MYIVSELKKGDTVGIYDAFQANSFRDAVEQIYSGKSIIEVDSYDDANVAVISSQPGTDEVLFWVVDKDGR